MHNPPHPGLTLRDDLLPALGINVTEAAEQLNVARPIAQVGVVAKNATTVPLFPFVPGAEQYPIAPIWPIFGIP